MHRKKNRHTLLAILNLKPVSGQSAGFPILIILNAAHPKQMQVQPMIHLGQISAWLKMATTYDQLL
jgi:hypothetical protein